MNQERGQLTILFAAIMMVAAVLIIALAMISQAIVHRARARTAADAVALAGVSDSVAGDELARWYEERGSSVTRTDDRVTVASGPSQAAAWAGLLPSDANRSPALVAIVARAEQLVDQVFSSAQWSMFSVTVDASDAEALGAVATELGLCEDLSTPRSPSGHTFIVCILDR